MAPQCCERSRSWSQGSLRMDGMCRKVTKNLAPNHFPQMLLKPLPAHRLSGPGKHGSDYRLRSLVPNRFTWGLMTSVSNQKRLALQCGDDIMWAAPLSPGREASPLAISHRGPDCSVKTQQRTPDQLLHGRRSGGLPQVTQLAGTAHDCPLGKVT